MDTSVSDVRRFIPFSPPLIEDEEIQEVIETLKSGWIGTGQKSQRFEEEAATYLGIRHAVAVSSCTAALHLSLLAFHIGDGDEVVTTPLTFAATANVIEHVRGKPVFADIDQKTLNIDPAEVEKKITSRTKAVIPVHFAGLPCDLMRLRKIAEANGLVLIEDAAHALGAEYDGLKIGYSQGAVCFSFYPTKNITTIEGGLVATNNPDLIAEMKIWRLHGMSLDAWRRYTASGTPHYEVLYPGYKYNMPDVSAAIGLHQLRKLDRFLKVREEYVKIYFDELGGTDELTLPPTGSGLGRRVWNMFTPLLEIDKVRISRDDLLEELKKRGVGTGVHYRAIHLHPYYRKKYASSQGAFPTAEYVSERIFSLPLSPRMTPDDVVYIADRLKEVIGENKR